MNPFLQKGGYSMEKLYENYGDINPLVHGGVWVKQINETTFSIIENVPGTNRLKNMEVDISSTWIERESVMSFIDMTEEDFDALWFAVGCSHFYGVDNFGQSYECVSEEELIEQLNTRGIEI